jgi:TRAP-type C4-dicarboxylate transport system permease small subunit
LSSRVPGPSIAARAHEAASRIAAGLAVLGAALLLAAAAIVAYSVLLRIVVGGQVKGDFEIVGLASGIAILLFLPYCQATRAHVTVDVFTGWLPQGVLRRIEALWSLLLALAAAALAWRLGFGLEEAWRRNDVTMMAQLPLYAAYAAAVIGVAGTSILALLDLLAALARPRGQNGHGG